MLRKIIKVGVVALVALGVAAGTGIASASDHAWPGVLWPPSVPWPQSVPSQQQTQCSTGGTSQVSDGTATVTAWATGCTGDIEITLRVGETTKVYHDGDRHSLTGDSDSTVFEVKVNGQVTASGQSG